MHSSLGLYAPSKRTESSIGEVHALVGYTQVAVLSCWKPPNGSQGYVRLCLLRIYVGAESMNGGSERLSSDLCWKNNPNEVISLELNILIYIIDTYQ